MSENPREIAVEVLLETGKAAFVEDLLARKLETARLASADRGLCQELVYGVVRWQAALDWLAAQKTRRAPEQPALRVLLRLGLYQIFWLDRVPDHAAVHETVQAARRRGLVSQAGFINAVLRNCLRDAESLRAGLSRLETQEPWIAYSHPEWLARRWQSRYGPEPAAALMRWNNAPPPTFARVNTLKTEPGALLETWRAEGVEYDFARRDWFEENLVFELKAYPRLDTLPSFQRGWFYIQDPSTLLAVHELAPKPGETILDLCAAPGGKLTFIAQQTRNEGKLLARDVDPERLKRVTENCERLGAVCEQSGAASSASCDRILVDAPCSNTGVIRRRVDLRWRIKPEEITRLRGVQLDLLNQAGPLLKSGGTLVYSTCSLEPEENGEVTRAFLASNPWFQLEAERELLPFQDQTDGAYVARLKKSA
ncbi:MAG TPA: 16S rRNA (cytosine(967)-C(5))-methyltransferase RsmB [Verrucomicrobiae bacterium]|nr:16S rRNA (cytosine(967)-C(5))-methyltransferase RsmB [Verrucomicrobiae bacterium]